MIDFPGVVAVDAVDETSPDRPSPEHAAAGVRPVAAHYGDPLREQRVLATGVGLVDRSHRGVVAVPGEDRIGWLHTLTTQHLANLADGQGTELLVLSPHGHVEQHAMVAEDRGVTWLDTEPGDTAGLLTYLEKMRFFSKVEPRDVTAEWALLSLVGPAAGQAAASLGVAGLDEPDVLPVPGPKFPAGSVPPRPSTLYRVRPLSAGGWVRRGRLGLDLLVPRAGMADVVRELTGPAGVPVAGLWAYEATRVAARLPRVGLDTDHRTIPAEVDLTAPAVHLEKGCYRGQETVARVHNLGRPPRRLVLLHLDGVTTDQLPAPGTPVMAGARQVGFLGTAVHHFELGPIALAVVKRNVPDDAGLLVGESAAQIDNS